jgi:hypothetical protein
MSARPRLRRDLVVVEQVYRGEATFIVKDPLTLKYFRFRPVEVGIMQAFDGLRSTTEVAAALVEEGINVTARVLDGFAARLSKIGLLERTLGERSVLELERLRAERRKRQRRPLFRGEVLRMRWSVGDPDALLDRWKPWTEAFFTRGFVAFSAACLVAYLAILVFRWDAFAAGVSWIFTPSEVTLRRVVVLYATGMATLAVHELGHGVACKHYGGHVHEMGAMLVYFEPAFYCNVNDAWTFPDRAARLWVTAAGGWIQFITAALGAVVWAVTTPGTLVSEVALAAMLVGGIATLLANANPLLPLDGYFALSDWLEMPNLRQRAFAHAGWWFKRTILRLDLPEPAVDPGERRTLLIYGVLATAYIGTVLTLIASHVHGWLTGVLGTAGGVAFLAALALLLREKLLGLARLARATALEWRGRWTSSPPLRRRALGLGLLLLLVALVPWPITVPGEFVTAPPRTFALGAPDPGQVAEVYVAEGTRVAVGTPVLRLRSPALERLAVAAAHERDSLARLAVQARAAGDAAEAEVRAAEVRAALARAQALEERLAALTLRAPAAGQVITPRPAELTGRPATPRDTLVALAAGGPVEARVRLARAGATLVRPGQRAEVRRADGHIVPGRVASVALAADPGGGGEARVLLEEEWPAGLTGPARVTVRRSTLGGAAWWRFRELLRTDLLF